MNIQHAADRSGLSADTIRFYERRGVLPRPPRKANGYRDYSERHVETLKLAAGLRSLGLALEDMGQVLTLAHDGTCGAVRTVLNDTLVGRARRAGRADRGARPLAPSDRRDPRWAGADGARRRLRPGDEPVRVRAARGARGVNVVARCARFAMQSMIS